MSQSIPALIRWVCLGLSLLPCRLATAARLDWGDAPASYSTRLAQNGPRQEINATLRLDIPNVSILQV
ncbi:MAG: hypothetical protein EXS36_06720 [Pedosphaera sp.]|nr:hypothetical protein [Pedosphaera sp.]